MTYAGFHIETSAGFHILIDPYLDNNKNIDMTSDDFEHIDLILVSHGPFDHVGDTAKLAKKHKCAVVCPDDVKMLLIDGGVPREQITMVCWGLVTKVGNISIKTIENHHRSLVTLKSGMIVSCPPVCFVITLEDGTRIYNSGDTAIFSDMKLQGQLYRPHIGLMNVTGDFEMDPQYSCAEMSPYEAALATQWLGLDTVLCCHYIRRDDPDIAEYMGYINDINRNAAGASAIKAVALEPGGWYEYSCPGASL
ncbi:MAG: MBL fold metallo-hydrolase [Synergistaceae bacterium]|nr:MBL fold metallo-hydrolase [Synergistaceae bacterium]